jgi:hypothetical protein
MHLPAILKDVSVFRLVVFIGLSVFIWQCGNLAFNIFYPYSCYPRSQSFEKCLSNVASNAHSFQNIDDYLHRKDFYVQSVFLDEINNEISMVYRWPSPNAYFYVILLRLDLGTDGAPKRITFLKRGIVIDIDRVAF